MRRMLSRILPVLAVVLAGVTVCCTATANAALPATIDKSICGTERDGIIASGERDDLRTEVLNRQGDTQPTSEITAEDCLSPGFTFSSATYVASDEWSIEIANADNESDFPLSVRGGGVYNITVDLRVNIPMGQTGTVSVVASPSEYLSDPPPRRDVAYSLAPIHGSYLTGFGNGTHTVEVSFSFHTPDVRRESWADMRVDAELFEGNESGRSYYRDFACHYYCLTILPAEESVVDVKFTGTIESLDIFEFFGETSVPGAYIRIDEVTVQDPWSRLTSGNPVYVGFEGAPRVEQVSIGVGDKVEVCCDYHPDAGALIWAPQHYITQIQTFQWVWVLVGLTVAGVPVYFLWWRRKSRT